MRASADSSTSTPSFCAIHRTWLQFVVPLGSSAWASAPATASETPTADSRLVRGRAGDGQAALHRVSADGGGPGGAGVDGVQLGRWSGC